MIPRLRPRRPNDLGLWQDHIGFSVHFLFRPCDYGLGTRAPAFSKPLDKRRRKEAV
jgi:hypothetical protein